MVKFQNRQELERFSESRSKAIQLGDDVLCKVLGELYMYCSVQDAGITPHLAMAGHWESWVTLAVLRHMEERPGLVCVNVGANVGYYALLMAKAGARKVFAYEPVPGLAHRIRKSVNVNGLDDVLQVFNIAASNREGLAEFWTSEERAMNGTLSSLAMKKQGASPTSEVKVTTLQTSLPDGYDFLFMDAEGHEREVMEGSIEHLLKANVQACIEWSPKRYEKPQEFYDWITKDLGFKVSKVHTDGKLVAIPEETLYEEEVMMWLKR
jgi:FkbM family methyltransferase